MQWSGPASAGCRYWALCLTSSSCYRWPLPPSLMIVMDPGLLHRVPWPSPSAGGSRAKSCADETFLEIKFQFIINIYDLNLIIPL